MIAKQVDFYDNENQEFHGGILIDNDYIICGCCGGVFEVKELDVDKIYIYDNWIDIEKIIRCGGGFSNDMV